MGDAASDDAADAMLATSALGKRKTPDKRLWCLVSAVGEDAYDVAPIFLHHTFHSFFLPQLSFTPLAPKSNLMSIFFKWDIILIWRTFCFEEKRVQHQLNLKFKTAWQANLLEFLLHLGKGAETDATAYWKLQVERRAKWGLRNGNSVNRLDGSRPGWLKIRGAQIMTKRLGLGERWLVQDPLVFLSGWKLVWIDVTLC